MITDKKILMTAKKYLAKDAKSINYDEGRQGNRKKANQFICHAIEDAYVELCTPPYHEEQNYKFMQQIESIKNRLTDLLGCNTVEGYLMRNGYLSDYFNDMDEKATPIQQFRVRWLNHLIKSCDSKGSFDIAKAKVV